MPEVTDKVRRKIRESKSMSTANTTNAAVKALAIELWKKQREREGLDAIEWEAVSQFARNQWTQEACHQLEHSMVEPRRHSHYFKDVEFLKSIDVYRVLDLFDVRHSTLQHAIKKLLVSGGRGGGKDAVVDVQEAIDSLDRYLEMVGEDGRAP